MKSPVVVGCCLALLADLVVLGTSGSAYGPALAGVVIGIVLVGLRSRFVVVPEHMVSESISDDAGESLQRWQERTESLINWSDATRRDWDRHVRPVLARQFEMATKSNQRRGKDPAAFKATGVMLFGPDLWQWVDPDNVLRTGVNRRGPGRHALEEIIERLE